MHTFFAADLPAAGGAVDLEGDEAHHLKVRRLRAGEAVRLVDGRGGYAAGTFAGGARVDAGPRAEEPAPAVSFTLVQAALPPERLDYAIEKAVEAGAHAVVVFTPERSALGKRKAERADRWERIAREAAKQCGRARFPAIRAAASLAGALAGARFDKLWLADPEGGKPDFSAPVAAAALVVGPEGGLTEDEKRAVLAAGGVAVWLGPWVLRSETVAPAGLALLQYGYGAPR